MTAVNAAGRLRRATVIAALLTLVAPAARAQQPPALDVEVVYLGQAREQPRPLSLVDPIVTDAGLMGARLGTEDNGTTGRFLNQDHGLTEVVVPETGDPVAAFAKELNAGRRLFVVDLPAADLLRLADHPGAAGALLFNGRAEDDSLRGEACRANVFHTIPSRAMKADALAQFLAWKRWTDWLLIVGGTEADKAFADAVRRSAERFGAEIVEEREYAYQPTARRTDTGSVQIQRQVPVLTQGAEDHDVVVVADEADTFGEYLPYNTSEPRPVVGTQGLVPTAWSRAMEQWGGTQMQGRFEKLAGRAMTERDYGAWLGVRSVGEAVTRTGSADPKAIRDFLLGPGFALGAFKGQGLTFRAWNNQMRQPILLTTQRVLVSVSPQEGFLHQRTPLDTLGFDEPETACDLG